MANSISQHSKEIAKGTFWNLAGNLAIKLIGFFYMVMLARMVSVDDVGTFYLALSIFGLLSIFTDLGFSSSFSRYVPYLIGKGEEKKLGMLIKFTYTSVAIISAATSAIIYLGADAISSFMQNPNLSTPLRFLAPYLFLNSMFWLNIGFLQGKKQMKEQSMLQSMQNIAKFVLTAILFLTMGTGLASMSFGFTLSFFFVLLLSLFYMRNAVSGLFHFDNKESMKSLVAEILPFGITITIINYFWVLISNTDRIMIGYFLDPSIASSKIAIYTVATTLSMLIMIFPSAISSIFFPLVSGLYGQGKKDEMNKACATAVRWTIFITFPLALALIGFPDSLLRMFYGDAYAEGWLVLVIFTIGLLIRSLTQIQSLVLAGMRLLKIELGVALVAVLINISLNYALIPVLGVEGSALASTISFLAVTVLFIYYSKKITGFKFPPEVIKAIVAGVIAIAILFMLKPYFASALLSFAPSGNNSDVSYLDKVIRLSVFGVLFMISSGIFVLLLFLLRCFHKEDSNLLSAALRRARVPGDWISFISGVFMFGTHGQE